MSNHIIHFLCDMQNVGWSAKAIGFPIVTQGDTIEELNQNIVDATSLRFESSADHEVITFHNDGTMMISVSLKHKQS